MDPCRVPFRVPVFLDGTCEHVSAGNEYWQKGSKRLPSFWQMDRQRDFSAHWFEGLRSRVQET